MYVKEFDKLLKSIEKRQGKTRITISIDEELDKILKARTDVNVSGICNKFLWYYVKREIGADNDNSKNAKKKN